MTVASSNAWIALVVGTLVATAARGAQVPLPPVAPTRPPAAITRPSSAPTATTRGPSSRSSDGSLTPQELGRLTEMMKRLTPKQRKQLNKTIKKMTPEERQQLVQSIKHQLAAKGSPQPASKRREVKAPPPLPRRLAF